MLWLLPLPTVPLWPIQPQGWTIGVQLGLRQSIWGRWCAVIKSRLGAWKQAHAFAQGTLWSWRTWRQCRNGGGGRQELQVCRCPRPVRRDAAGGQGAQGRSSSHPGLRVVLPHCKTLTKEPYLNAFFNYEMLLVRNLILWVWCKLLGENKLTNLVTTNNFYLKKSEGFSRKIFPFLVKWPSGKHWLK